MGTNTSTRPPSEQSELSRRVVRRMLQVVIQMVLIAAILFISAWRLDWIWAWLYLGVGVGIVAINALVMSPELIAERGQPRENVKSWDKIVSLLLILPTLGVFVVAGLDENFDWSPQLPVAVHIIGLACIVLGQGLFAWAMASNIYFSTAVRIQLDRGHTVASGGPYRYVRHPGYVGMIVAMFATSLALGSLWGLIPAGLVALLYIVRTALEDQTLQVELAGYKEYAQRTRYRLIPGVW